MGIDRRAVAVIAVLLFVVPTAAGVVGSGLAASSHSPGLADQVSDFVSSNPVTQVDTPRGMIVGVIVPFLLVFGIFYFLVNSIVQGREALIIAASLALLFVFSGASIALANGLMSAFGYTDQFDPGTGDGSVPDFGVCPESGGPAVCDDGREAGDLYVSGIGFLEERSPNELQFLIVLIVMVIAAAAFGSKSYGSPGIGFTEGFIVLVLGFATWMAIGGATTVMLLLTYLVVMLVAFGLIDVWRESGGVAGLGAGVAGLIAVGWLLRSAGQYELVPALVSDIGSGVLQGTVLVIFLVLGIIGVVVYLLYMAAMNVSSGSP